MYDQHVRAEAAALLAEGLTASEVARRLQVARSTVRGWRDDPERAARTVCPRCDGKGVAGPDYAALLGYYLGDGCISPAARCFVLRISCDRRYPVIIGDVAARVRAVHLWGTVHLVAAPGATVVQSGWKHWPCLFPQHGPGKKHERPIVLEDWQREVVAEHPGPFLRGLFHSDGSRVRNWATRTVGGEPRRYDYPRWQFSNRSEDIQALCSWALDLAGIPWRRSARWTTSVSKRGAVAELDRLIGPKS